MNNRTNVKRGFLALLGAVSFVLFGQGAAQGALTLSEGYIFERLSETGLMDTAPEEAQGLLLNLFSGQGALSSNEALEKLLTLPVLSEEQRSLLHLHQVVRRYLSQDYTGMFDAARAWLGQNPPGRDRLALCEYLANKLGMTAMDRLPIPWETRADWVEFLANAIQLEYVPFDRSVVDALAKCGEAMDQIGVRHGYELSTAMRGLERAAYLDAWQDMETRTIGYLTRARAIYQRGEQLAAQVASGARTAPEGRFGPEEAKAYEKSLAGDISSVSHRLAHAEKALLDISEERKSRAEYEAAQAAK